MSNNSFITHDIERSPERWLSMLPDNPEMPVLQRAYRAVVVLLLSSGLRGLQNVKTAEIAKLSNINESTLFRYVKKRDNLVADAVDWCWQGMNETVAEAHRRQPLVGSSAKDLLLIDLESILSLYGQPEGKLIGTGALLSYRRAEQLTDGFDCPHQLEFQSRLTVLTSALVEDCDTTDRNPSVIATYLTNYLATVWFTWLADPDSHGPDGLLGIDMVRYHLTNTLDGFAGCGFRASDVVS